MPLLCLLIKFISKGEPVRFFYPKQKCTYSHADAAKFRGARQDGCFVLLGFLWLAVDGSKARLMEAKQKVSGCLGLAARGALTSRVLRAHHQASRELLGRDLVVTLMPRLATCCCWAPVGPTSLHVKRDYDVSCVTPARPTNQLEFRYVKILPFHEIWPTLWTSGTSIYSNEQEEGLLESLFLISTCLSSWNQHFYN
jgi:hypothetical protein